MNYSTNVLRVGLSVIQSINIDEFTLIFRLCVRDVLVF
jgi:hypothetical protein